MSMERRSFLQGVITSVVGSSLIVRASDADVLRFGARVGDSTVMQPGQLDKIPAPKPGQYWPVGVLPGGKWLLYNGYGLAVGAVMSVERHAGTEEGVSLTCAALPACHEWLTRNQDVDERMKREGRYEVRKV